jgi:beta-lactam-binding protein with PASTA domain
VLLLSAWGIAGLLSTTVDPDRVRAPNLLRNVCEACNTAIVRHMAPLFRRRPPDPDPEPELDETIVIDDRPRAVEDEVVEEEVVDERPPPPKIWPWLLALALLVLGGLLAYWLLTRDDDKTTVPAVVGLTEQQARTRLAEAELETQVARGPSDRPQGVVFEQTPGEGTQLDEGQTVRIGVSSGPELVEVPAVRDLDEDEALRRLQEAGFETQVQRVFAGAPVGQVVEQEPAGGEEAPRGSTVLIKVSKGRNLTPVPDVVGQTEDEAVQALRDAGFTVEVFDVPATEPEGTVVSQSPAGGGEAPPDSRVRINVSTGEQGGEQTERPPPDVVGDEQTDALQQLEDAGFRGFVTYRNSEEPEGTVLEQGEPQDGRVPVVISTGGNPRVDVPEVRGDTEDAARQVLEDAGFVVEVIRVGSGSAVEDQQPRPNVQAYEGATVTLFVG